jgi:hypothetical protein
LTKHGNQPQHKTIKLPVKSPFVERFQPLLRALDDKKELNEVLKNRVGKACTLLDEGVPLFPNDFRQQDHVADVLERFEPLDDAALEASGASFQLAGRIVSLRSFGKVAFFHLQDASGRMQVYVARDDMGAEAYGLFKKLDLATSWASRAPCSAPRPRLTIAAREVRLITSPCVAAREVSRPEGPGDPLPPALRGSHRHRADQGDIRQAHDGGPRVPQFFERARLHGSGNAHDAAHPRGARPGPSRRTTTPWT